MEDDFFLMTLSQREGERREVRRRGRFVQSAISSPSHYHRLVVKMYINTLNIWTTYKFNSVSNINNKDIKWVCRVIYHTHTNTHTHTQLSDKDNEEIEARGLKIVLSRCFMRTVLKEEAKSVQVNLFICLFNKTVHKW